MGEELTPRHVLHEHVEVAGVLRESLEVDLRGGRGTMKGWEMELKMRYSLEMWSTCCDLISSSFFMIFTQLYFPVFFFFTSRTCPNEPALPHPYPIPGWSGTRSPSEPPLPDRFFTLSSTALLIFYIINRKVPSSVLAPPPSPPPPLSSPPTPSPSASPLSVEEQCFVFF